MDLLGLSALTMVLPAAAVLPKLQRSDFRKRGKSFGLGSGYFEAELSRQWG